MVHWISWIVLDMADIFSCMAVGQPLTDKPVELQIMAQSLVQECMLVSLNCEYYLKVKKLQNAGKYFQIIFKAGLVKS